MRSRRLVLFLALLQALSLPASLALFLTGLATDWPAVVFGLAAPCLLLAFFCWHVAAHTAEYQASRGPSKVREAVGGGEGGFFLKQSCHNDLKRNLSCED